MAQVQVNIGGRPYRLACGPGEEAHMTRLAELVDARMQEMRGAFRDIDDQRIVVMAALGIADELVSLKPKAEALTRETAARQAAEARVAELEAAIAATTARVEALAESLASAEED
jgi:cell division protein ZapA